jgi:RNA polymerase sigma-70 factor (ECF subfamily)
MASGEHDVDVAERAAYLQDLMLVDRCLSGQQAAARELFRHQQGRVQATLYRVLGRNRDMEDLLQEVFIQVFKSLPRYRGEARLSTWIDRIAVRVAYRYIRKRKSAHLTLELSDEPLAIYTPADRRALAREGVRRFYSALESLPPAGRLAYALFELDGRTVAEVADLVGASVTATKLRIWRARRALHKHAATDPVLSEFLSETSAPEDDRE